MTLGLTNRPDISGLTCPASIPLISGVAASVSVPTGDRWYRFVVADTGVLSTAFTLTGGTGTVTGYLNGSCASLPASSFSASATAFPDANISVTAGDVVRIKVSQSTGTLTGSLTVAPAGIVSITTTTDGLGIVYTFSDPVNFSGSGDLSVSVNGSPRWTVADATALDQSAGDTICTITFAVPAITSGQTVLASADAGVWTFQNGGANVPAFTNVPVTNTVP
jgi:hypothetical protein